VSCSAFTTATSCADRALVRDFGDDLGVDAVIDRVIHQIWLS
jgi:hypothetical protein